MSGGNSGSGTSNTAGRSGTSTMDGTGGTLGNGTGGRASTPATRGAAPAAAPERRLLRGLPWLVWRRHRTALSIGLLVTLGACALFAYERIGVMDFLDAKGSSPDAKGELLMEFQDKFNSMFSSDTSFLQFVPALVAIFFGAPLIASEQEHGTVKLVATQSTGRGRWIAATLGLPLAIAVLCTVLLTAAFTWLWSPARELAMFGDWLGGGAFESTGPVLVAMTLFLTSCGIAFGMLIKRVVAAMVATAVFSAATSLIWTEKIRVHLGTLRNYTYPFDGEGPVTPRGSIQIDDWLATADGKLFGINTCTSPEATADACRAKLGIVNRVIQYLDYPQMAGMQWLGAGILLALTVLVLGFVLWQAHRRPL
ncbi:ABC transporter permease subunit [Streptomyces celluloflavus]|uniref:ABC transporter permease subunit n=1 Tax=Streptomyces celluloflavus TaxID=58344 RepID=UPI0036BEB4B4